MDDFEEWKAREKEALKHGLEPALSASLRRALDAGTAEELRTELLTYARFLDLRKEKEDYLSVVVRLISFELTRDHRTLFLVIRRLYEVGKFELCALLCTRYIDEFEDHTDQTKLIYAAALVRIGDLKRASDVAKTITNSDADTWIDGSMRNASDFQFD